MFFLLPGYYWESWLYGACVQQRGVIQVQDLINLISDLNKFNIFFYWIDTNS